MYHSFFQEYLKHHPSMASYLGDRSSDDRVEISISPAFKKEWNKVVQRYRGLQQKKQDADTVDDALLRYTLKDEVLAQKLPFYMMPISSFSNPVLDFTFMERTIYPENIANAQKRHQCYIRYFDQCIENMREGMRKQYVIPKMICEKVIEDITSFISSKDYITTKKLAQFFEREYKPALERLLQFIQDIYYPVCRDTVGMCGLPRGKALYKHALWFNNTLRISATDIHNLGLSEVKRIRAEFKKLIPRIYPRQQKTMTVIDFIERMQKDPKNFMHDDKEILAAYTKQQQELRDTLIPQYFYKQVTPYQIHRVPKMLEASSAGAFYYPGNNKRPGRFFLNVRDPKENPKYSVETLAIHEGEPGHHYQYQYMLDKGLPMYRVFGTDGTAFAEGWALYAESLSRSDDPHTIFGRLTYEMFRAVRCVVDTGIHYFGWSYDRALSYMKENIAMKESELVSELIRYICIPGQATAYKVGEQFFLEHRDKYLKRNPTKTIKDFHALVLDNGVLPLTVLKKLLR
jgi:uncharacterized protein (DUF885 family)